MKRTMLAASGLAAPVFVVLLTLNHTVSAATYRIDGQITSALFLYDYPVPAIAVPFPVPYIGVFDYQPQLSLATFEFVADMSPLPPFPVDVGENLFSSVLQEDAAGLVVDFDRAGNFFKRFDLTLDKSTGQGTWELVEGCLTCDYAIHPPNATATITSFSLIPEPGTWALTMLGAATVLGSVRRSRR